MGKLKFLKQYKKRGKAKMREIRDKYKISLRKTDIMCNTEKTDFQKHSWMKSEKGYVFEGRKEV